jgi:hypothetical protein
MAVGSKAFKKGWIKYPAFFFLDGVEKGDAFAPSVENMVSCVTNLAAFYSSAVSSMHL